MGDGRSLSSRAFPIILVTELAIAIFSMISFDPWVSLLVAVLIVVTIVDWLMPSDRNVGLLVASAVLAVASLALASFFGFLSVDDPSYRVKEISLAISSLSTGFMIVLSMISRSKLEMPISMVIVSAFFTALLLVVLQVLNLLLFDTLAGNTLIVDNRWLMFIVSDITLAILILGAVLMLCRNGIPFEETMEGLS